MADIIDRLITRFEFVGVSNAIASMKDFADAFRNLQGPGITTMNRINAGLMAVGGTLGVIAGIASVQAAGAIAKVSMEFDGLQRQLEVLYGSQQKARQAFDWIVSFAAVTPFTVDQATEAFIRLGTLGIQPTLRNLKIFAGTAQMMRRDIKDVALAVGFGSTGNFARLSRGFGISREMVARNAAPGTVPLHGPITNRDAATEAIIKTLEQKFGRAFERFSTSPQAAISNFQDSIQRFAYILAGGRNAAEGLRNAFIALKAGVDLVAQAFLLVRGMLETLFYGVVNTISWWTTKVNAMVQKIPGFIPGSGAVKGASQWLKDFLESFSGIALNNAKETRKLLDSFGKGTNGNPPTIPGMGGNFGAEGVNKIIQQVLGGGYISRIGVAPSELPGLQREFNQRAPRTVRIEGSDGSNLYAAIEDIVNKVNYEAFRTFP